MKAAKLRTLGMFGMSQPKDGGVGGVGVGL